MRNMRPEDLAAVTEPWTEEGRSGRQLKLLVERTEYGFS